MENTLSENNVSPDPLIQFDIWYKEHLSANDENPDSVYLGTASTDGKVSVRTVLLKDYSEAGFTFYTNYNSKKASQISLNPNIAMLFYWPEKGRQVRIEGIAEKVAPPVSDEYFGSRPRESQISAWASQQSSEIPDRNYLIKKYNYYTDIFSEFPVPRPDHWGGFRLIPDWFEFWENGKFRLHNRIVYTRRDNSWLISRLAP